MELIGIRATLGPLRETTLELRPGLAALYGINGAGKSSLLEALTWAMSGVREQSRGGEEVTLFVRLTADEDYVDEEDPRWNEAAQVLASHGVLRSGSSLFRHTGPQSAHADIIGRDEVISVIERDLLGWDYPPGLPEELLDSRVIGLRPVGQTEPKWEVWLCVDPRVESSVLAAHTRQVRSQWDEDVDIYRAAKAEGGDPWPGYGMQGGISETDILIRARRPHAEPIETIVAIEAALESGDLGELLIEDGMPAALARLGAVHSISPLGISVETDRDSADSRTAAAALHALLEHRRNNKRNYTDAVAEEELEALRAWASGIGSRATATFRQLLLDAPSLTLRLRPPVEWLTADGTWWSVEPRVALDGLSEAQRRWAAFAISQHVEKDRHPVRVVDEPEAALHRSAEEHMARGLSDLAAEDGGAWVVATHSPALLNNPRSRVMHVKRFVGGVTRVEPLVPEDLDDLRTLGLTPSDLLRRWRVVLLVEGRHEELILDTVLGQQLHDARVFVIPLHGGAKLSAAIDSRLLWHFTDAHVVAVLDNLDADAVQKAWLVAIQVALAEGIPAGVDLLTELLKRDKDKNDEMGFIRSFLARALQEGDYAGRVTPFGFSRPDITDYLPLDALLPAAAAAGETWDSLRQRKLADTGKPGGFKDWLSKNYGRREGIKQVFAEDRIVDAATRMTDRGEFDRLLTLVQREAQPL